MTATRLFVVLLAAAGGAARSDAGFVIYQNVTTDFYGTDNGSQIGFPNEVWQPFSVSVDAVATSATIGVWVPFTPGHLGLQSVTYRIGTTQFGDQLGAGTVPVTSTYLYTNTRGYDIFESEFALPSSLPLSANTTYYFSLSNAVSAPPTFTFWDTRDATLTRSLTLFGEPTAVATPEPSGLVLFGLGALGLCGYRRLRRPRLDR